MFLFAEGGGEHHTPLIVEFVNHYIGEPLLKLEMATTYKALVVAICQIRHNAGRGFRSRRLHTGKRDSLVHDNVHYRLYFNDGRNLDFQRKTFRRRSEARTIHA